VLQETGQPLSRLKQVMRVYPQVLMNVSVGRKPPIEKVAEITEAIREVERALGDAGRVLVRYSGTQPLCRVMVEGPGETETRRACERVAQAVAESIGG
jgi:phosphoglucosamine mutase